MLQFGRFIEGAFEDEGEWAEVVDPADGETVGRVRVSGAAEVERAMAFAADLFPAFSRRPVFERARVLELASDIIEDRAEQFADAIRAEAGKPILLARAEVVRAVATLRMTAAAVRETTGTVREMDGFAQGRGLTSIVRRFPVGPVAAISPFNFPLNLVVHKVAPALAVGCPVIHKPARRTPVSACLLAQALADAGLTPGAYQVVVATPDVAERLATDERIALLTFTGSAQVGWKLRSVSGRKKTVLELGGNAAVIVERDADLARAARQIALGAFAYSGQVCISVQRILVSSEVYDEFKRHLLEAVKAHVRVGKTSDPAVLVGPMISAGEADRVEEWVREAVALGAESITGELRREGNTIHPIILEGAPAEAKVSREEVFGPVAIIAPFSTFEDGIAAANDSRYGLQAGVFTSDVGKAMYAFEHLEVGGVILNDAPTRRVDHMPYGGVKESGEGREGPRSAIEHMTEERLLLIQR